VGLVLNFRYFRITACGAIAVVASPLVNALRGRYTPFAVIFQGGVDKGGCAHHFLGKFCNKTGLVGKVVIGAAATLIDD